MSYLCVEIAEAVEVQLRGGYCVTHGFHRTRQDWKVQVNASLAIVQS